MTDLAGGGKDTFVEPTIVENADGTATVHMPKEIAGSGEDRRAGRDREEEDDRGEGTDTSGGGERPSRNQQRRRHQRAKAQEREDQIGQLAEIVGSQQRMLQALSRGQQQTALATLEREAQDAKAAHAEAQARHSAAVEKGDGRAATEAQSVMRNAEVYYARVAQQHGAIIAQMKQAPVEEDDSSGDAGGDDRGAPAARGGPPRLTRAQAREMNEMKEDFLDKHPWIDPESEDDIQVAIRAIDAKVAKEFKPYTQDYWDELSERIADAGLTGGKKERPVRRETNEDDRSQRRDERREQPRRRARDEIDDDEGGGPPIGGAGRGRGVGQGAGVKLTAEMVSSLEAAGIPLTGGDESTRKRRANIMAQWASKPAS